MRYFYALWGSLKIGKKLPDTKYNCFANNSSNNTGGRKEYLDVLKFIGIFFTYLGHFADAAGRFYPFVFLFHVPLFFFLGGCTESLGRERSYPAYFLHKVRTIVIPWLVFAFLSLAVYVVNTGCGLSDIRLFCLQIAQGCVRNRYLAGGLWFLTCLFVISVAFRLVEKWNKIIIFLLCVLVYLASQWLLPQNLPGEPSWYWNADSAMYYLLYYCFGYLFFPYLDRLLTSEKTLVRILKSLVWIFCSFYTLSCFFDMDALAAVWAVPHIGPLLIYIKPLLMIYFFLGAAYILRDVTAFRKIGRDTLYLCGSEMIIKLLFPAFACIFGLEINVNGPVETLLYTALLLYAAERLLVPAEKYLLSKIDNCVKC